MDILRDYARQVLEVCPPGYYSSERLNAFVEASTPGAAILAMRGMEVSALKVIDEDLSLDDFMRLSFFERLSEEGPFTFWPILLRASLLAGHDSWADWRTLEAFMAPYGLLPFIMFRNEPIARSRGEAVYLCDIRLGFDVGFAKG